MTTILINTASCNSDYIVQLSNTYSLGTYVTLRDNGSNPSFFTSNSIVVVVTSGYTFYDGSQVQYIRKSGDFLTFAAMTSSWRLVNTAAYVTSGNALLSNASTTNMFIYGELSLSNLITASLTATGGIDIETPPTVQGIPVATGTDLVSTVVGLGTFGYFSSVSFMNSSFVSTVVGLGGYGYISTPQLLSTVAGFGSYYISSAHLTSTFQGLGSYYLSTPSLLSTVGNLGTFGYISTSWLASTVGGLGSFMPSPYISTTQLFSTVSNSLQNTSSNNQSTFANLGRLYVSSASLVSTIRDMSNLYVTRGQFDSTTAGITSKYTPATTSTIAGLGGTYISSLSLVSTTVSLAASNQSTVANKLSSLGSIYISSASLLSTVAGLGTYGHISLSQLTSTTSGVLSQNTSNLASTVAGLGNSYVSTGGLISTTRGIGTATDTILTSTIAGLGSLPFSLVSSSSLQSTVAGLGTSYISLGHLISTTSNLAAGEIGSVNSTIAGLGSLRYISTTQLNSTVTGISATNRSNLISTVNTLGLTYISSSGLQSTVAGLGSFGYVSLSQLTSTTSNLAVAQSNTINSTLVGLGSFYISTAHVVSTVIGFSNTNQSNLISTVNTLGLTYISSTGLQSTVAGLGSFGYVSLSQLTSTTTNLLASGAISITSTITGLGSLLYISTTQLNSTVQGISLIHQSNLISTVNAVGTYPGFISSLALRSTVAGLGTYGHISLSQLTSTTLGLNQTVINDMASTTNGLGSLGYISTAQIVSTVQGFSNTTRVSLVSTVNTLSNVTTVQLASTQTGLGTFTTTGQVDSASIDLNNSLQIIYNSTIAGLGSYYISTPHVVSTVIGINSIQAQSMTSTTNTLGSSVPAYISTPHLVSTTIGVSALGYLVLPNLTSTTANFESGSYGTTSTLAGLGSADYISTAQLVSTVLGFSNTTRSNLVSTVNTLGTSPGGFISSASLVSTVAGLGTATYISAPHLVSTTLGLPPPTVRPDSMTNAVNTLAGTIPQVTSVYQGTGYYTSITYTPTLIIYADTGIYTNNYDGTNHITLYSGSSYIYGLACDGKNVYSAGGTELLSISLTTGIAIPLASTDSFVNLLGGGLCLDSTFRNLYICDNGNGAAGRLLRYSFSSQTITIVAFIPGISKIAIDSSDTYGYVTKYKGVGEPTAEIVKVTLSDGTLSYNPISVEALGICLDSIKPVAYIAQNNGNTIYQINLNTYVTTVVAGNGSAALQDGALLDSSFNRPYYLVFNVYNSSIYVADTFNRAIRKISMKNFSYISSFSLQSSVAGLGSAPFSYISTPSLTSTVAGLGTTYLSTGYLVSTTVGSSNSMVPFTSTTAGLGSAGYISTSALSNIVPDVYSVTTFASVVSPYAIAITSNFIFYTGGNNIYRNTFDGKNQIVFFTSNAPFTMLACDLSNIYTVNSGGNQILSISMSTSLATVIANTPNQSGSIDGTDPSQVRFNSISDISIDPAFKFLYICEYSSLKFRRLQLSNGNSLFNVTTLATTPSEPIAVAVDSFNEYAYIQTAVNGIYKYTLFQSNIPEQLTASLNKYGFSIDTRQKFLYATDRITHNIFSVRFTPGTPTLLAGTGTAGYKDGNGTSAQFNTPTQSAYNPYDSCVYIADTGNNAIRKMTTTLYASTIAGLNASAVVQRITASNSTWGITPVDNNYVTSSYIFPSPPGLQLWLDGVDPLGTGVAPPVGTSISTWVDKSRNGYNAVAPFSAGTYSNGVTFSGVYGATGYSSQIPTNMSNQTVFTVYTTSSPTANMYILGTTGSNSGIAVGMSGGSNEIALSYSASQSTPYQVVQTFAGSNGVLGQTNGTGSSARFNAPIGLGVDTLGNVYVAENTNHVIRKITPAGVVTVFAGIMGSPGFANGGLGVAQFNEPFGLAIRGNDIYVSDIRNYRIRKITSDGTVSTLAGNGTDGTVDGTSTTASFSVPYGITVDSSGIVFVAEYGVNIIRRIDSGGNVSTLAGRRGNSGSVNSTPISSTFYQPYALACDAGTNIFVADAGNNLIRKISNIFSVIANLTTALPLGITLNTVTGDVYFTAKDYNSSIMAYNPIYNPSVFICANIPNAQFNFQPWGIVYDVYSGLTFATDKARSVLYKVTPGTPGNPGTCAIVAGSSFSPGNISGDGIPTSRFNNPAALTSCPAIPGAIFIADVANNAIRTYDVISGQVSAIGINNLPAVGANNLTSIAITQDGTRIYIAFTQIHAIYYKILLPINNNNIVFFAGNPTGSTTGFGFTDGQGSSARFNSPEGICVDPAGNVYVSDYGNRATRIISPDGYVGTVSSPSNMPVAYNSNTSPGIAVQSDGSGYGSNLFVGVYNNFMCSVTIPRAITFAGSGTSGNTDGQGTAATFSSIQALTIDSSSTLYVAQYFSIRKITSGGLVSTLAGNGLQGYRDGRLSSAQFTVPAGLAAFSGTLYISERFNHTIRYIVPTVYNNTVTGGNVTTSTQLFTSVVQMGVLNGVTGYLNGTLVSQGSIFDPFVQTGTAFIGMRYNMGGFVDRFYTGSVQEIIVYNTALNTTQRQDVETYLTNKWISKTGLSRATTSNIYFSNASITINPNLYATTITAATFTASMAKGGTASNGFFKGDSTKVTNISDRRLKYDIRPIENALEKVSSMQAVRYRLYRDPSQAWIGYVAQDLEVILPEVVRTDGEGWKSIQYSTLPALIIEAVKELNEKYEKIKYLLSTST